MSLPLLVHFAFRDGSHHAAASNVRDASGSLSESLSTTCKEVLQSVWSTQAKRPSVAHLQLAHDNAEDRVHALYCWMKLCRMSPDAALPKLSAETCGKGLLFWEWSSGKDEVMDVVRQLNLSKPAKLGSSKRVFPLEWHSPSNHASAAGAQNVVIKRYVDDFLLNLVGVKNSCGDDALRGDVRFNQMMAFWMDAVFMEFLRGKPGIPNLLGAGDDPLHDPQQVPVSMAANMGKVSLSSDAYFRLARLHARELALAIMRMFQSVCDGGAFQFDQGPEQYMATRRASDNQIDVWMIDSPIFLTGPVIKYQRKYSVPSQMSADGRPCLPTRSKHLFLECDGAAGFPLFPATSLPIPDLYDCTTAALKTACCDDGSGHRDKLATEECSASSTSEMTELSGVSGVDFAAWRRRFEPSESGREAMCRQAIVRLTVGVAVGAGFLLPRLAEEDHAVKRVVEALEIRLKITAASDAARLSDDALAAAGITNEVLPPDLERLLMPTKREPHVL